MEQAFYELIPTRFGPVAIVWWDSARGPRVRQVFLSREQRPSEQDIREHSSPLTHPQQGQHARCDAAHHERDRHARADDRKRPRGPLSPPEHGHR